MKTQDITEKLAIATKQYVLYLSHSAGNALDLSKAAPKLSSDDLTDLADCCIWLTFPTYGEARSFFESIVGDDGPTKTNPYDGPCRVYALLAGPDGLITENT